MQKCPNTEGCSSSSSSTGASRENSTSPQFDSTATLPNVNADANASASASASASANANFSVFASTTKMQVPLQGEKWVLLEVGWRNEGGKQAKLKDRPRLVVTPGCSSIDQLQYPNARTEST
ncbi:hypothetical protein HYFRA_00010950 [Hymenoscyphus fraxineus]|uniref:Uncharacterized protein n=1 Tax=Hymenoscyphus fraxineus TaxID=746836 RepID=A0A9N9PJD8_9HELO|nr:hypothetical protein HYFRA_00010950 [Hymenoscyphus fraxineus]